MSTGFNENISTCLCVLILICLNTFLIACRYVHLLCWSHASMFTCLDDSILLCLHTLMIICPFACMPFKLICLDSLMITYPYVEMFCMFTCLVDHVLTYVLALTIIFSHFYLLWWSYVSRFTYFDVHIVLYSHALIITHTSMFTCFDNHMPHVYRL